MMNRSKVAKMKKAALVALEKRRIENTVKVRIDDSRLPAGSPRHYYCKSCQALSDTVPEGRIALPKMLCPACQKLKNRGWLEELPS